MRKTRVCVMPLLVGLASMLLLYGCASAEKKGSAGAKQSGHRQGLVGAWYHGCDLTKVGDADLGGRSAALRTDGATWDLAYPRMVQRPDGKAVTIYYFNTKELPAQHIAATIWDPNKVK